MSSLDAGGADAAILETFVVPRYLAQFADPALEVLLVSEGARIVHLGCRTGFPDGALARRLPYASIAGTDPSPSAIELARAKAQLVSEGTFEYRVSNGYPTPFPMQTFSHALTLHPSVPSPDDRQLLFMEMRRLLAVGGQGVVALPLRGSFQELLDLLREHALKTDAGAEGRAIDAGAAMRPNIEALTEELEASGFEEIDITLDRRTISFASGRDFFEDPVARLLILPDVRAHLAAVELGPGLAYVKDAIDKYWAESPFELGVTIGCASFRKV